MDPLFIPIARVLGPWGVRGEVKAESLTDFSERFLRGETVYLQGLPLIIESGRPHGNVFILKISTIDSRDKAEAIRGMFLEIPFSNLHSLGEGEYYRFQLLGLNVLSIEGESLGQISDIIQTGSNDVYEVSSDKGKFLIPSTDEVIKSIDIEKGCMIIDLLKGLI
ncbi:MAG: ribosome maturation factor RimM [Dehalococcoidia bacterium]|jgi:16S rRNA processing protein RimM